MSWLSRSLVVSVALIGCTPVATAPQQPSSPSAADHDDAGDADLADPDPGDSDPGDSSPGDPSPGDAGGGDVDGGDSGPYIDPTLPKALAWVRRHPMFVSALTVDMGAPTSAFAYDYFDVFNASAAHLWATGLPYESAGWAAAYGAEVPFISWVGPDGQSYAGGGLLGGQLPPLPGRIGYQIGDEPGISCPEGDGQTSCALEALAEMGTGIEAIRAQDPEALLILNFNEGPYIDAVLSAYAGMNGDIVSYDHYVRDDGAYEALARFRAAGLAQRRPYWRYMKSFYFENGDDALSESDLRWDAFSGLLYGYTGHSWFLYTISPNADLQPALFEREADFDSPKTPLFAEVAQINQELRHLGRVVTQLTSTDVRYIAWTSWLQPDGTSAWSRGAGGDPYLSAIAAVGVADLAAGFFRDDAGEPYVMVQSVAHSSGKWPTGTTAPVTARLTFDFSQAPASLDRTRLLSLDKVTGAPATLALVSQSASTARLEVTLAAGDVVLFKYASGAPLALGPLD